MLHNWPKSIWDGDNLIELLVHLPLHHMHLFVEEFVIVYQAWGWWSLGFLDNVLT